MLRPENVFRFELQSSSTIPVPEVFFSQSFSSRYGASESGYHYFGSRSEACANWICWFFLAIQSCQTNCRSLFLPEVMNDRERFPKEWRMMKC